jgi:methionyl-tRNA synthetase
MIGKFQAGRLPQPDGSGGTDEMLLERTALLVADYEREMGTFGFSRALSAVFELTALLNRYIDTEAPWRLAKENGPRLATVLHNIWNGVRISTLLLFPFMPSKTAIAWRALGMSREIERASFDDERRFYHAGDLATIDRIQPLFPRREV